MLKDTQRTLPERNARPVMPLSLAELEAHPGRYIGPALVTTGLQMLESGVLINQSFTFFIRAERESKVVLALVTFATAAAL